MLKSLFGRIADGVNCTAYIGKVARAVSEWLTGYRVYGNTSQNGIPSTTSPVEVITVGDKTANLYKPLAGKRLISGILENGDGFQTSDYMEIGDHPYVAINYGGSFGWYAGKSEASLISYENKSVSNIFRRFARPEGARYCRVTSSGGLDVMAQAYDTAVSSVEPYVPYGYEVPITVDGVTTTILLDEPLYKIPAQGDVVPNDMCDYIDYENQRVVRKCLKQDITNCNGYSLSITRMLWTLPMQVYGSSSTRQLVWCNRETFNSGNIYVFGDSNRLNFYISDPSITDGTTMRTWLNNNYTYIVQTLDTPIYESITLPQIKNGTVYSVDTDLQPSKFEINRGGGYEDVTLSVPVAVMQSVSEPMPSVVFNEMPLTEDEELYADEVMLEDEVMLKDEVVLESKVVTKRS